MKCTARREPGMALALALVVLVLVGVLAATICFIGVQEARMGESMRHLQRAFGVAEEGISAVIRTWDPTIYNVRPWVPFDSTPVPGGYPAVWAGAAHHTGAYGGHVYKLNGELYFIDIAGRDSLAAPPGPGGGVWQRVGVLAHVLPPPSGVRAAVTGGTGIRVSGPVRVDGNDHVPTGWERCGPSDSARAGIHAANGGTVVVSGSPQIRGSPPTVIGAAPRTAPVAVLEGVSYTQLAAWATHTLAGQAFASGIGPVVVDGRCDVTVATNWGDGRNHNSMCGNYFPVVHVTGDASMGALQGQGILLVDGDLVLHSGFEWFGIALVRGRLTVEAPLSRDIAVWGAVLAEDSVQLEGASDRSVAIAYSKCAILKALESVALVTNLRSRAWLMLSEVP